MNELVAQQPRGMDSPAHRRALTRQLRVRASDDLVQDWAKPGERIRGRERVGFKEWVGGFEVALVTPQLLVAQ
jgi:hypothetical protein